MIPSAWPALVLALGTFRVGSEENGERIKEIRKLLRRATYRNLHALITLYGVPKTHRHEAYMLLKKALQHGR